MFPYIEAEKNVLVIQLILIILFNEFVIESLGYELQFKDHLLPNYKPEQQSSDINVKIKQHQTTFNLYNEVDHQNRDHLLEEYNNNYVKVDNGVHTTISKLSSFSNKELFKGTESFIENKQFLGEELSKEVCRLDRGCQRKDKLNETYLSHCGRYKLENLLSDKSLMSIMHDSTERCERILKEFFELDKLIQKFDILFAELLTRYNCHNGYSVKWTCEDCQKAYKDWLCATNLPYYVNGEQIKPCISFCERVEQRCPYLHPIQKEQYGGQPTFICRDPNIPFVPAITPDIPYSEPSKCYDLCHLSDNLTELVSDSLSKYEFDKCPDRGSIAEEVRRDQLFCGQENSPSFSNLSTTLFNDIELFKINNTEKDLQLIKTYTTDKDVSPELDLYNKKFNALNEVLAIYENQPKTHSFGSSSSNH